MRKNPPFLSVTALLLGIGACSTQPAANSLVTPPAPVAVASDGTLGVTSVPAAGSVVAGPVYSLELTFTTPVALSEVMVSGPDGQMPMMLSPAGPQTHFSIPLPGLGTGKYTVAWKATLDGQPKSGSFAFTVK